jgi:hypothetical protein
MDSDQSGMFSQRVFPSAQRAATARSLTVKAGGRLVASGRVQRFVLAP